MTRNPPPPASAGVPLRAAAERGQGLTLLCATVPSFMINLDSNIVAVSLSSIARSLHASFDGLEWVVSAYTLTFAALVMPAGALADCFGRKRLLMIGLALFTLASFLCGAANSILVLDGARALQGVGAALQLSAALAILSHAFQGPARARAFAFWGSVIGIAICLGPIAGGVITQLASWRWAFYVNVPVGLAMLVLTAVAVTETRDPDARRLDLPGALTFSGFLLLITLALISGGRIGWERPQILLELLAAAALFAVFVLAELLQSRPMLDLSFFRRRTYVGANLAGVSFAGTTLTMLTFIPIYFQQGLGYPPMTAGLLMLPMALPLFLAPRLLAGRLARRLSGRAVLVLGLSLISVGLFTMALEIHTARYIDLLAGLLITGAGAGLLNGETAKVSMTVIPRERAGMASGMSGAIRFSGIVIGFAGLGAVLYESIHAAARAALPAGALDKVTAFAHAVAAGHLSAALAPGLGGSASAALAAQCLAQGYGSLLCAAAAVSGAATLATWFLIDPQETAPARTNDAAEATPPAQLD